MARIMVNVSDVCRLFLFVPPRVIEGLSRCKVVFSQLCHSSDRKLDHYTSLVILCHFYFCFHLHFLIRLVCVRFCHLVYGRYSLNMFSISVENNLRTNTFYSVKVHCHGDFAALRSVLPKYLTRNFFSNMKLYLEHREENTN